MADTFLNIQRFSSKKEAHQILGSWLVETGVKGETETQTKEIMSQVRNPETRECWQIITIWVIKGALKAVPYSCANVGGIGHSALHLAGGMLFKRNVLRALPISRW